MCAARPFPSKGEFMVPNIKSIQFVLEIYYCQCNRENDFGTLAIALRYPLIIPALTQKKKRAQRRQLRFFPWNLVRCVPSSDGGSAERFSFFLSLWRRAGFILPAVRVCAGTSPLLKVLFVYLLLQLAGACAPADAVQDHAPEGVGLEARTDRGTGRPATGTAQAGRQAGRQGRRQAGRQAGRSSSQRMEGRVRFVFRGTARCV